MRSYRFNAWHTRLARAMKVKSGLEKFRSQQVMLLNEGKVSVQKLAISLRCQCYDAWKTCSVSPAGFLWICRTISLHDFVLWLELFSSSKPSENSSDKYGEQLACMYISCPSKHETTPRLAALWLDRKKQKFSGTNKKPELLRPFGTGLLKPCPQGLFLSFLTFARPNFFLGGLDIFPPPKWMLCKKYNVTLHAYQAEVVGFVSPFPFHLKQPRNKSVVCDGCHQKNFSEGADTRT